ncbi:peptidyl-prolyl cis-trans isomerase [Streptomyces libani subsp. rufus]|nr:peptidyl-prolyl cis-trans isomerase [Streptomyces libani subsp. rufus]
MLSTSPAMRSWTRASDTSLGEIVVRLEEDRAPKTVKNFVGLATGTIDWTDPASGQSMMGTPLYDGTLFHRVIPGFMIQGGDPFTRTKDTSSRWGTGGPGYKFADEFHPELRHVGAGVLAMANSGPGTNGSQWYITEGPTPHLDRKHTVFGQVVSGQDIVHDIANVATTRDRPDSDVELQRVEVFRQ